MNETQVALGSKKNLPVAGAHAFPLAIKMGMEKRMTKRIVIHVSSLYLPVGKMRR
jgi:hypothetical protein